ncbi:MAG: right-handed parallel beta-helix repeat-containing protein [Clostridia bacterium]|nr:right-handed parallel beta-helix repeat-containing protein [Clostridia bacterium]
MIRLLSFLFASVLLFVTNIFSTETPADLPRSNILIEQMPNDTSLDYEEINSANGVRFYIGRPKEESLRVVNASDFGLSPENDDNFYAFADAINYCKENPGTKLVFDKGVYKFASPYSIFIDGCENLVIDGNGAEFVFSRCEQYHFFRLVYCNGVEIKNLTINWDWENQRIGSVVKVVNADPSNNTIDLEFIELDEVSESIPLKAITQCDSKTYTFGEDGSSNESYLYQDPTSISDVKKIANNVLRVTHNGCMSSFEAGETYIVRHFVYNANVFNISAESEHVTFDNIKIYGSPGMAFVADERASHFQILNTFIGTEPGYENERHVSLGADAIHIADTNGCFKVDGCDFSRMGDDALNVHDNLGYVNSVIDENTLHVTAAALKLKAGSVVGFNDENSIKTDFYATITDARLVEGIIYEVDFDKPVSDFVNEGFIMYYKNCNSGNYVISNNYFHEHRARGVLLQSPNGLCENNRFYKTQGMAIRIILDVTENLWQEGTGVDNLVIRNNSFENCDYGGWGCVIEIGARINGNYPDSQPFTNIEISNNQFVKFDSLLLSADNVDTISLSNNYIDSQKDYCLFADSHMYFSETCKNISIENNSYSQHDKYSTATLPEVKNYRNWLDIYSNIL